MFITFLTAMVATGTTIAETIITGVGLGAGYIVPVEPKRQAICLKKQGRGR